MFKRLALIIVALALTVALPELLNASQLRPEDPMIVAANDEAKPITSAIKPKDNAPKPLYVNVDHGYSLELKTPASSVFIANPDIADVQVMSPTSIMIFGKRAGDTTFMATEASGATLEHRTIRVVQDLSTLRREINNIIPGNKIRVESVPNGIVLAGIAKDAATIADVFKLAQRYLPASGGDIINRIRVGGSNQVQIRVRFAEVARNIDSSLGFNWQSIGQLSGFTFGLATGVSALAGASSVISTRPSNTALSLPNNVIGVSKKFGDKLTVDGLIDALAQDGLVTILAEPNLTAMSGETANFLAGGEFPVPIPQGNGTISISFKSYGISLAFTPTLIGENRINLHVKPEVSQLTTTGSIIESNITVPAISTRRAETTVEVASGQSFAIAGLLDNNQTQTINKYPLLGDLPIIGALFRSTRFQNGQTELVIIITPYIVRPSGEKLALPTDGYSPPNEEERLADLRYSSANPEARTMSGDPVGVRDISLAPDAVTTAPMSPVVAPSAAQTSSKQIKPRAKPKPAAKTPPSGNQTDAASPRAKTTHPASAAMPASGASASQSPPPPPAAAKSETPIQPPETAGTTATTSPATTPPATGQDSAAKEKESAKAEPMKQETSPAIKPEAPAQQVDAKPAPEATPMPTAPATTTSTSTAPATAVDKTETKAPQPATSNATPAPKPVSKKKPQTQDTKLKPVPAPASPHASDHATGTGGFVLE
ncbi:MAG: pilus assembly protein N-terminal domain-containing protein [Bdellovibrionales bacterium]